MSELLPCPFCGGTDIYKGCNDYGWHEIYCNRCSGQTDDGIEEKAIAAWNRRTQPEPDSLLAQMAEALRVAIEQNYHDMIMTGEELRKCSAALSDYNERVKG